MHLQSSFYSELIYSPTFSLRRLWSLLPHVETALLLYLWEIRPISAARKTLGNRTTTVAVSQPCREYRPDTAPMLPFCGTTGSFDQFSGTLLAYLRNRCTLYFSDIRRKGGCLQHLVSNFTDFKNAHPIRLGCSDRHTQYKAFKGK